MNGETLLQKYERIKRLAIVCDDPDYDRQLDEVYRQIVELPVTDIESALHKIRFAHYCIVEEADIKEAANLVYQTCLGLSAFQANGGAFPTRKE